MKQPKDIPDYLLPYIVKQDPSLYTAMDQATWRFIMKLSQSFFARHAHPMYLEGLAQTGISAERIPLISEMDQKLRAFGWRAVAVSGFIPPAVFMEFLSLGILPIACDMRKIENLAYTPAPDIVHEAAGHAPIIADPGYADYLHFYGELARKVIFSSQDMDVYLAIRNLSDTKEDPRATAEQIQAAQTRLDQAVASVTFVSEATWLARMSWWTIEYGLIGSMDSPQIYGAGLLSSVGESFHCFDSSVKKIPLSVECIEKTYDITKPQPQLYVARNFEHLKEVLSELASKMSYSIGGTLGLDRAVRAKTVNTVVLDSGLQISGVLSEFEKGPTDKRVPFLKFTGPVQISFEDTELNGHSAKTHGHGFSSPLGKIREYGCAADALSEKTLTELKSHPSVRLSFESGYTLKGRLGNWIRKGEKNLVLSFGDCTVLNPAGGMAYNPAWGAFDLACGSEVVSVFGGPADQGRYLAQTGGFKMDPQFPKTNLTPQNTALNDAYATLRLARDAGQKAISESTPDRIEALVKDLEKVLGFLKTHAKEDWLLRYELLELDQAWSLRAPWAAGLRTELAEISKKNAQTAELIQRGLELLPSFG